MTVKFRDPISAKACIIVIHSLRRRVSAFVSHSCSRFLEDARKILRRSSSRSLPLHRPTAVQALLACVEVGFYSTTGEVSSLHLLEIGSTSEKRKRKRGDGGNELRLYTLSR